MTERNREVDLLRRAMICSLTLLVSSCVGVGFVSEKIRSVERYKNNLIYVHKNMVGVYCLDSEKTSSSCITVDSSEQLIEIWGEPEKLVRENNETRLTYDRELGWSGAWLFAIVPIPILLPVGYRQTTVVFTDGQLTNIYYQTGNMTYSAACGIMPVHDTIIDLTCKTDFY